MQKLYADCLNALWRAVVGYYAVVVLFILALEIPYIISGFGRIAGIQLFAGGYATLQVVLKSGNPNTLLIVGIWSYLGSLLFMGLAIFLARSSKQWIQSGAAYLVLFASSFSAKLTTSMLIQDTDQLTNALRRLFPNDLWTAKLILFAISCAITIGANYWVFHALARSSSSTAQKLATFAIRYILPISLFSLLAAARPTSFYDGLSFNGISFLLALTVALFAWFMPHRKITRLASE